MAQLDGAAGLPVLCTISKINRHKTFQNGLTLDLHTGEQNPQQPEKKNKNKLINKNLFVIVIYRQGRHERGKVRVDYQLDC